MFCSPPGWIFCPRGQQCNFPCFELVSWFNIAALTGNDQIPYVLEMVPPQPCLYGAVRQHDRVNEQRME